MFYNCYSLLLLNINSNALSVKNLNFIFNNTNENLTICINDNTINNKLVDLILSSFIKNCERTCHNLYYNKFIENNNYNCINYCEKEEMNIFQLNNFCYQKPYNESFNNNTLVDESSIFDSISNNVTDLITTINFSDLILNDSIFFNISLTSYINHNSFIDLQINSSFDQNIILNLTNLLKDNNDYSINVNDPNEKEQFIKNELLDNSYEIITKIIGENKKDIIIQETGISYQFTSSDNQKNNDNPNISSIILGDCETELKNHYKIPENESLLIYKIDKFIEGSLISTVEYEVYNFKTKELLNLSYCSDTKINILYPVNIEEDNLFLYNSSSEYYTDMCYSYTTEKGTDITLNDRKNEYRNNNMFICEVDCDLDGYNKTSKKASCKCQVKVKIPLMSEIVINKEVLYDKIKSLKNIINLNIMKCYNTLFTKEGLINNIGSYIMISILLLIINNIILFVIKDFDSLISQIHNIISYKNKANINNACENNSKKTEKSLNKFESNNIINNVNNEIKKCNNNPIKKNKKKIKIKKKNKNFIINLMNTNDGTTINKTSLREIQNNNNYIFLKNEKNVIYKEKYSDYELNNLRYIEAVKIDKRNFFEYYLSILKLNQILAFTFYAKNDNNSRIIKISIFLFSLALYLVINALFFDESALHSIYENQGNFIFIYQIPQIIYSSFISTIIMTIIRYFSLSQKEILKLKKEQYVFESISKKVENTIKCLKIKFTLFFIIELSFLIFFWYYLASFCAIYKNTQLFLVKNSLISFGFSLLYPLFFCLLPGILRIPSLKASKKDKECMYKLSKILQLL